MEACAVYVYCSGSSYKVLTCLVVGWHVHNMVGILQHPGSAVDIC